MRRLVFALVFCLGAWGCGNGSSGSDGAESSGCESSADCNNDAATFGQICIASQCQSCISSAECQRVEFYGADSSCVDGVCRIASGGGGEDCSTKVCGDQQLCDVIAGVATCLEECETGFDWDPSTASCVAVSAGCESVSCAPRQLCAVENGTAACQPECEAGFEWNATNSTCDALANANCESGDPDSILDSCVTANRVCVESDTGAACEGCVDGNIEVDSVCRPPETCSDLDNCVGEPNPSICLEEDGADARCVAFDPDSCTVGVDVCDPGSALNPTSGQCVACGACDGANQTGELYPITSTSGACLCVPSEGFFIDKSSLSQSTACDADEDGWTRVTARNSIEDADCAIRANARCDVRTIDRLVFYSDESGESAEVALADYRYASRFTQGDVLSLYESDVNDDLSLRGTDGDFETIEPYYTGAGDIGPSATAALSARDLNSLTKACAPSAAGDSVDYNANGIADINEWHGMLPNGTGAEAAVEDFTQLAYFIELMEGWYEQPVSGELHGSYHFREKSRPSSSGSAQGLPFRPSYDDSAGDFGDECYRKEDRRFAAGQAVTATPNIGMDFSRVIADQPGFVYDFPQFFGHSSQFKCVSVFNGAENRSESEKRQAPQQVAAADAGSVYELTECLRPPGSNALPLGPDFALNNPSSPPFQCSGQSAADGLVAFATVVYRTDGEGSGQPGELVGSPGGCMDECADQGLLPPSERCETFNEANSGCTSNPVSGELTACTLEVGCAEFVETADGFAVEESNDSECGMGAGACGRCVVDLSGARPAASCAARPSSCAGNCSTCDDSGTPDFFTCKASPSACTGDCDACSGAGTTFNCAAVTSACTGCATCQGSGTNFSCRDTDSLCDAQDGFVGACDYGPSTCTRYGDRDFVDYSCISAECRVIGNNPREDRQGCNRGSRVGRVCGTTNNCGGYGSCGYSSACDETASESRSCFNEVCASDTDVACTGRDNFTQTRQCATRNTDGASCDSRSSTPCTYTDRETGMQLQGRITFTQCGGGSCSERARCGP